MTTQPVPRLVVSLAVPTIVSMLVTSLYNMADTYFMGQISTAATAAVGIAFPVMSVVQAVGFFFGHGSGNFISRRLGAGDLVPARRMAATGFYAALLTGLLLYAASAAEAFAADRADPPAAFLYALARFALDFGGPLAVPRIPSLQSAAVRAGICIAAGIALLLLAGFVCGNAWPLFCTALGCFLSPAAVCLPLAYYSAPQGGEEE